MAGGWMREDFEKERLAALAARRAAEFEGPDHRSLEARYGPGSFGCHEALHVTNLVVELLERELAGHSAVLLDAFWYSKVREAQALLYTAYSQVAQDHLAAPLPENESSDSGSAH